MAVLKIVITCILMDKNCYNAKIFYKINALKGINVNIGIDRSKNIHLHIIIFLYFLFSIFFQYQNRNYFLKFIIYYVIFYW